MEQNNYRGMRKKTINSVITKKFNDFVNSITDIKVQELVRENTIITGGCIASMLTGNPVNDFDLYFTNKQTVLAVAEYYVALFKESKQPKHKNGQNINIDVVEVGDRVRINIKSAGIAGENDQSDYQYFESRPDEEAEEYTARLINKVVSDLDDQPAPENNDSKYQPVFLSGNAITLSDKVQLILRFYGKANEIHTNYDFVHCTNYWTSSDCKVHLNQPALESLMAKELVYVGSLYPLASLIRIRKFIKRGWVINAGQILKIAFQVSKLDLTSVSVLEDQLTGVDVAYFNQLVQALQEKQTKEPDFKIEYNYVVTIIDKMF